MTVGIPDVLDKETLDAWADAVKEELDLDIFSLSAYRDGDLWLHLIIVKPEELKQGKGTIAMNQLIALADFHQRRIWLTPGKKDPYYKTTSRRRLIRFYKRFGFVENKGRNKDFSSRELMYRKPVPKEENNKRNPTEPLPSSFQDSIALMTKEEFLDWRNPGGKWHGEESYDFDLADLNKNYRLQHMEDIRSTDGRTFRVYKSDDNYVINCSRNLGDPFELAAIIYEGTLYYSSRFLFAHLPTGYLREDPQPYSRGTWVTFDIKQTKLVKYLHEYMYLINDTKQQNLQKYPHLHQRIQVRGESYQIRFEQQPELNRGITIVILNSKGEVVSSASNEWGATLITTAKEYRRRGLGTILGRLWYDWNPAYPSGGFTASGMASAIAIWESRVREFRSKGWYSELIKQGHLTKARVKEIFSGVREKLIHDVVTKKPIEKKILILVEKDDNYWGPTFVVYDEAFFDDQDEKYIYGFGFFRDNERVGSYLYRIEYDRLFHKLTTYVALQIARNNQEKTYIGGLYGDDLVEFDELDHIQQEGDYIYLTEDVLDLELFRNYERRIRHIRDSFNEKYYLLLEMAHSKWD